MIFVAGALVLILFEVLRGWRLGLVRQLARMMAILLAYAAAIFGGKALLPVLRSFFEVPDILISAVAGAILALLVYFIVAMIGAILFKRTAQQKTIPIRWLYGVSGAVLGIFFGAFTIWLVAIAIRALGTIAETQLHTAHETQLQPAPVAATSSSSLLAPRPIRNPSLNPAVSSPNDPVVVESLAKLKNSIELGPLGDVVKSADVVPDSVYETLAKVGQVFADPAKAERFLSYPGAKSLTENPRIVALRDDPEIMRLIQEGRFFELLQNPRIIDAANDPGLAAQVRSFQFQKALDYAVKR
jgi:uncharacterized membrane protein required for colicin V production